MSPRLNAAGTDIPESVDGMSLLPFCRDEEKSSREYIHGEHARGEISNHLIANGNELYAWYSQTGEEQYFDLESDPDNLANLAAERTERVEYWRGKLTEELTYREEGYVENGRNAKNVLSFLG